MTTITRAAATWCGSAGSPATWAGPTSTRTTASSWCS